MKKSIFIKARCGLSMLSCLCMVNSLYAQSNHSVSFTGSSGDFSSAEKYSAATASTDYYVTYDATYIYIGAFRTGGNTFSAYDHFTVYVDADPRASDTSGGNGSTGGVNWDSNTPTLPIQADYRICIRNNGSGESFYSSYGGGAWTTGGANGQAWTQYTNSTALEVRVPITDLGTPNAMYIALYMSYNTGFYSPAPGSFTGNALSGYFGGMGITSTGFAPLSVTNLSIVGSLTNGTPNNSYPYGYVNLSSGSYTPGSFAIAGGGSLNISGATMDAGSDTITFNTGSTFNVSSGTFMRNTSTLNFLGTGTIIGTADINNATIAGGVDFGSASTINGNLQINTGGYVNTNPPQYAVNSYLVYNGLTGYSIGAEWATDAQSGKGVPYNVRVTNSNINFGATSAFCQLNGNLLIGTGSTFALSTSGGGDMYIAGNWIDSGTFVPNNRAVFFIGTTPQTINKSETFPDLIINNPTGVTAYDNLTITSALTLTEGILVVDTVKVTNAATGAVAGYQTDPTSGSYSTSGYINGILQRAITGTGQYDFPIGTDSNYELLSVIGDGLIGTSMLTVNYVSNNGSCSVPDPNTLSVYGTPIQTLLNGGYWIVNPDAEPTGEIFSIILNERGYTTYPGSAMQMTVMKRSDCNSAWTTPGTETNSTQSINNGTATAERSTLTSFSSFGIGFGDDPLPVTLESFIATAKNNTSVYTTWIVANQFSNKAFNVQRSADGYKFTTIGTIEGCGTCHDTRTYNLDDSKPLTSTSYYRLQQVDIDGNQTYSATVPVTIDGDGIVNASLYPNPTNANIWLDITDNTNATSIVTVSDITGTTIVTQTIPTTAGSTHTQLNTESLSTGVYLVTVRNISDGSTHVLRFVKSN